MTLAIFLIAIALLVFGVNRALGVAQRSLMYPRPDAPASPPPLPPGSLSFAIGPDRDVEAWFLRPPAEGSHFPLLIFMHGNGELIDHWLPAFEELSRRGIGVLLVEYPGYGRSGGTPNQGSITETVASAYDVAVEIAGVDRKAIIAYGRSLGGGAACQLAMIRPISGLILESTFTSLPALASRLGFPGFLVQDRFPNLEVISTLKIPLMVIHGEHDELIPVEHGEALAEAAGVPLLRLSCGHNDCPRPWNEIQSFLEREKFLY